MTSHDTLESVEKLLAERRKIRGWLEALEARQSSTLPGVYRKVHDDYTAKLDKVQGKLQSAADGVQALATDVEARLAERDAAVAERREARAEAELRAMVGEYSERDWEKKRAKFDEEIAAAAAEQGTLQDELGRLKAVLADMAGQDVPAAEPTAEPTPEPVVEVPVAEVSEPVAEEAPVETPAEAPAAEPVAEVEEPVAPPAPTLVIHEQVVETNVVVAPAAEVVEPPVIAAVEPTAPLAPSFDELDFLRNVVGRQTPAAASATSAPTVEPPSLGSRASSAMDLPEAPIDFPDPVPEPRVSQEMTPPRESFFGRPTPRSSEAVKSLKCGECGTLNYPTEWYCERCGGELAAL